ncbi:PTS sugar transporter subunit IIB [Enterococcus xiangfangensis]|uniref:PTS sugar transporter subunit IIB n=1 Tax=Enterococcus xiangfangensis TaxID=1296537 RepID=A0ABU3F8G7_9ENTE|nr:PTS sugar transporter subunit IIB [Enterococcus xiangfangensis]MDT2758959.1 PTS sugar transporter subunit IIB [Enterococcus xiangfangensis]
MKTLLVCAGGFSTTMMMESMKKIVKESKSLDEKDYLMEAIGVDKLDRYINDYDVILVGPQLSHKYDFIKGEADKINKPTVLLTSDIYGSMDGATVMKQALVAYRKNQASKTQ